jgi:hypothetical protein
VFDWHENFLSYLPEIRIKRAESQFSEMGNACWVDFCPFRGPDAPLTLSKSVLRAREVAQEEYAIGF